MPEGRHSRRKAKGAHCVYISSQSELFSSERANSSAKYSNRSPPSTPQSHSPTVQQSNSPTVPTCLSLPTHHSLRSILHNAITVSKIRCRSIEHEGGSHCHNLIRRSERFTDSEKKAMCRKDQSLHRSAPKSIACVNP